MNVTTYEIAPATAPTVPGLDTRRQVLMRQHRTPKPVDIATDLAIEGQAMNAAGRLILFNPSPEIDSIAEEIAALERNYGVPRSAVRSMLAKLGRAIDLNGREERCYRDIAGALNRATAVQSTPSLARASTVRGAYALLREPLGVLAANRAGQKVDGRALVDAAGLVRRVVEVAPRKTLLSPALERQLRRPRMEALHAAIEAQDRKAAA